MMRIATYRKPGVESRVTLLDGGFYEARLIDTDSGATITLASGYRSQSAACEDAERELADYREPEDTEATPGEPA